MTRRPRKPRAAGFTLIELLIVIALIGILAAIAIPQLRSYQTKGYNSQALSDAKNFYSSSVLASVQMKIDATFDAGSLPPGYTGAPPVSGAFVFTSPAGITCNAAFKNPRGTKTYKLDNDGNISVSE